MSQAKIAAIVDRTWRYVDKNGGPDKRFKNNRELPVLLYSDIEFKSTTGLNERIELAYTRVGDYFVPNITLREPPRKLAEPITKYGAMWRSFLRDYRPITYNQLLLSERLFPHLREVQRKAYERLDGLMPDMLALNPPPDKIVDSLAWAAHMSQIRHTAEKMMLDEVVYT